MKGTPCYNCPKRVPPDCNSWCEDYKEYDEERKMIRKKRLEESSVANDMIEIYRKGWRVK